METDRDLEQIAEAKAMDRRERSRRPLSEKSRALIRIQERNAAILKLRGKSARVWQIKNQAEASGVTPLPVYGN